MSITLVIVRCRHCLRREEYEAREYRSIQADIYLDGWRKWDRKSGEATCRLCALKETNESAL